MAYTFAPNTVVAPVSREEAVKLIAEGLRHPYWKDVVERYENMQFFYDADKSTNDRKDETFSRLFPKSIIESDEEYRARKRRMRILPIERAIIKSIGRIYAGHNTIDRRFADTSDFWRWKINNFDDGGRSADLFYQDVVFPLRQTGGFLAVAVDWMNDVDGNALLDDEGKRIPYAYVIRPNEIFNFERKYGVYRWMMTGQVKHRTIRYTLFAVNAIYVYEQEIDLALPRSGQAAQRLTLEQMVLKVDEALTEVENPIGRVPVATTVGAPDNDSGFMVGRPERYHLLDMYIALNEIFYSLNEISLLYSRPVAILPENVVRDFEGVSRDDGSLDLSIIRASLGQVAVVPEHQDVPSKLFWQADMSGMEALKAYFFELLEKVYRWASIRDKNNIVANNSGVSKAMDTVEERGLLAAEAEAMEALEREVTSIMFEMRGEEFNTEDLKYSKEFDLSTPTDLFKYLSEGGQYGVLNKEMFVYVTREFLRKIGAPQEDIERVVAEAEMGLPPNVRLSELSSLLNNDNSAIVQVLLERIMGESMSQVVAQEQPVQDLNITNDQEDGRTNND